MCAPDLHQLANKDRCSKNWNTIAQNRKCGRRKSFLQRFQPLVLETLEPPRKFELHSLWIFQLGHDDNLCHNRWNYELLDHFNTV